MVTCMIRGSLVSRRTCLQRTKEANSPSRLSLLEDEEDEEEEEEGATDSRLPEPVPVSA